MNAVNLIPADARARRLSVSLSPPTLGLLGGLVLVFLAAVLYVSADNKVASNRSELNRVSAAAAAWNTAAARYSLSVQQSSQRAQQLTDIRQLAAGRYPWSELLTQIGGLMPDDAALSSFQAATGDASATSGAPASGASSTAGSSSAPVPSVQLSGCAASQAAVADTMVRLHKITGVTSVTLGSSTSSGTAGSGSSTSSGDSSSSGGCPFAVQFQMTLTFGAASSSAGAASSSGSSGAATTPTTTSAAPAPVTASASSTTAAAQ